MKTTSPSLRGFSLIEVIITIAVFSFAFIGLIGIFPLALEQTRACINETRSAQLARMVFATLVSEDFDAAQCFGTENGSKIDLSNTTTATTTLFASYDVRSQAQIVRAATPPATAEYRLELTFERVPTDTAQPIRGALARLKIVDEPARKAAAFETSQLICKSGRAVLSK